jgi:hypothetical protein
MIQNSSPDHASTLFLPCHHGQHFIPTKIYQLYLFLKRHAAYNSVDIQ